MQTTLYCACFSVLLFLTTTSATTERNGSWIIVVAGLSVTAAEQKSVVRSDTDGGGP